MANVFISYNRQSESITRTLVSDIKELGNTVWFDQELSGGQDWWDQILKRIRDCDVFVYVLTQESQESIACQGEYYYADALHRNILPIVVDERVSINILPPALSKLSQIHFVDYQKRTPEAILSLYKTFTDPEFSAPKPLPDPLPTPPAAPVSDLLNLAKQIGTPDPLNLKDQSYLLLELKSNLRKPKIASEALQLIQRFRKRRDLGKIIEEEINEILNILSKDSSSTHTAQLPIVKPPQTARIDKINQSAVEKGASLGALFFGSVEIVLVSSSKMHPVPAVIWILVSGFFGAIAGAITIEATTIIGTKQKGESVEIGTILVYFVLFVVLPGAGFGGIIAQTLSDEQNWVFAIVAAFSIPIGAIISSKIGAIVSSLLRLTY